MTSKTVNILRTASLTLLLGGAAALGACTSGVDPEILNSAVYHEGYADGCATANSQSNGFQSEITENPARSDTSRKYIIGWRQGFYACGGQAVDSTRYNNTGWHHDIGD
jgi:hypothetical protein